MSELTIDETDATDVAHTGLDLDGLCSGPVDADACNVEDFFAAHDVDQNSTAASWSLASSGCVMGSRGCRGCVDNRLPMFVNAFEGSLNHANLRGDLAHAVRTGRATLLLRLLNVDDPVEDDSIEIRAYRGFPLDSDCATQFTGTGRFAVRADSLRAPAADIDADALVRLHGRIRQGRVVSDVGEGDVEMFVFEAGPVPVSIRLREQRMRFSLDRRAGAADRGVWAGWLDVNTLPRLCPAGSQWCSDGPFYLVDRRPAGSPTCVDRSDPMRPRFGDMSVGFGFSIVRAVIDPVPRPSRAPGACGTAVGADGGRD